MIRAAVITDEITQDFERALDVMLEYGVRDAELRGLWGTNVMDLGPTELERARRALDERDMRVCSIASPAYKCHLFPELAAGEEGPLHLATQRGLDEQVPLLERAFALARYFDTKLIRIFAFWNQGPLTEDVFAAIVEALRPGVALAEREDMILGLENEHACFLGTGADTARALAAIGSPNLRAIWDPGNAFFAGEKPFPDGYQAIRPYLAHVHVKDVVTTAEGPQWAIVGQGEIDYVGHVRALREDGYQGLLSLETHYKAPSGCTEESSRVCLQGLLDVMRQAGC